MGQWTDQDGYLVDQDYDDYGPPPRKRLHGCACFPKGDGPGYCPGQQNCPLCAEPDEPTEEED